MAKGTPEYQLQQPYSWKDSGQGLYIYIVYNVICTSYITIPLNSEDQNLSVFWHWDFDELQLRSAPFPVGPVLTTNCLPRGTIPNVFGTLYMSPTDRWSSCGSSWCWCTAHSFKNDCYDCVANEKITLTHFDQSIETCDGGSYTWKSLYLAVSYEADSVGTSCHAASACFDLRATHILKHCHLKALQCCSAARTKVSILKTVLCDEIVWGARMV